MKLPNFSSVALAMLGFLSTSLAADYADWVAKGYRWSAVNGPHAYIKKEDAKNERLHGSSHGWRSIGSLDSHQKSKRSSAQKHRGSIRNSGYGRGPANFKRYATSRCECQTRGVSKSITNCHTPQVTSRLLQP